jgi:hypothetical protein
MALVFANSGQVRLAYSSIGTGDPVLMIHAGVTDRRSWRHLSDRLAPGHQVIGCSVSAVRRSSWRWSIRTGGPGCG